MVATADTVSGTPGREGTAIRALLIDVGGVLHRYDPEPVAEDIRDHFSIGRTLFTRVWDDLIPLLVTGRIDEWEFWSRFQEAIGSRRPLPRTSLFLRRFGDGFAVNEEVLVWALGLQQRGLLVGILSDIVPPQADYVRRCGLYDEFDEVLLSYVTGCSKPSRRSFTLALSRLGTTARETIFIDDKEANVLAAEAMGLSGVVFHDLAQIQAEVEALLRRRTDDIPDARVSG